MSGNFYFLDTNTIIQLLKGNKKLVEILQEAEFIACSVISQLEYYLFQIYQKMTLNYSTLLLKKVMDLPSSNNELYQQIINLRKDKKLKLPDAIIAGCSIYKNCTLITADKKILEI